MKIVAKVLLQHPDGRYLSLHRNNHPIFGDEVDLPGGTGEAGERAQETLLREIHEETGISVNIDHLQLVTKSSEFSEKDTQYVLYLYYLQNEPSVTISSEHKTYAWITRDELLLATSNVRDHYMRMVHETVKTI